MRSRADSPVAPGELLRQAVLILLGLLALFPMYFSLVNSLKDPQQFAQNLLNVPGQPHPENYTVAWHALAAPMLNSVVVTAASVLLTLGIASLAAYAFALMDFPGRHLLFALTFALLLIPGFLTLIPLYLQIKALRLPSPYLSVILPTVAGGLAFCILVLRTAFEGLPRDVLEAARIDGASHLQTLLRVVMPLTVPVLITVAIIQLVPIWNDYLLPSLILDDAHRTLPMALVSFQGRGASSTGAPNYGALMASYVLSALPLLVLFSFLMRSYIQGLTSGAVKG